MAFTRLVDRAIPLPVTNVDTDQIIPARFLKSTSREGFGKNLFRDWRYDQSGELKADFVLNENTYRGSILVAGKNFGCGSSREHAAWALVDYGFKVVISDFFADIFKNNALNNGLLPIVADADIMKDLFSELAHNPELKITVELENQRWNYNGEWIPFEINEYKKMCLLKGYNNMDFLLEKKAAIEHFEKEHIYQ